LLLDGIGGIEFGANNRFCGISDVDCDCDCDCDVNVGLMVMIKKFCMGLFFLH